MIALSSCEAEYCGLASAMREPFGERSLAADGGLKVGIKFLMDSTVGAAIGSRRGFGRVMHVSTVFLRVQDHSTPGCPRGQGSPDILTKLVGGQQITEVLDRMGLHAMSGQSAVAYATTTA